MSDARRQMPVGHLFGFPETVRRWMLEECAGHMVHAVSTVLTVYCGATRSSFTGESRKPPRKCRFCHGPVEEGDREDRAEGFILWHRRSRKAP